MSVVYQTRNCHVMVTADGETATFRSARFGYYGTTFRGTTSIRWWNRLIGRPTLTIMEAAARAIDHCRRLQAEVDRENEVRALAVDASKLLEELE